MVARNISRPGIRTVLFNLGSESFLEPKSLTLLVVPLVVVTSVAVAEPTFDSYLNWLGANLLSLLTLAPLVLIFNLARRRFFPDAVIPLGPTVLIAALIGLGKALLTVYFVAWLVGADLQHLGFDSRLIGGTLGGVISLLAASGSVLLLEQLRDERRLLLTAKVLRAQPILTEKESSRLAELGIAIDNVLATIRNLPKEIPGMDARILRNLVDQYVRPLSSSLYRDLDQRYQQFSFRELFRSAVRNGPPAAPLALLYLASAPVNIDWFGLEGGVVMTIAGSLGIFLCISLLNNSLRIREIESPASFFLVGVAVPIGVLQVLLQIQNSDQDYRFAGAFVMLIWFGQSSLVIAMATVALEARKRNRVEVDGIVSGNDSEYSFAILKRNRRLMANQMHGEIQSRLMSLVLASESGNALRNDLLVQELEAVSQLLENLPAREATLSEQLQRLESTWSGFAKLEIDLGTKSFPQEKSSLVFALIEEGVSNAFRHGLADHVKVTFQTPSTLIVIDNGLGPKVGKPGSGAALFAVASSSWILKPGPSGGSRLEIDLLPD